MAKENCLDVEPLTRSNFKLRCNDFAFKFEKYDIFRSPCRYSQY